jgi:AcrR family transcriptional regulator
MAQKRKSDQTETIAEAALSLAEKTPWDRLTFKDIAKKAKVKVADVEAQFSDAWDILKWVLKSNEAKAKEQVEDYLGDDWRDNLAEIFMMRFELAQAHRKAFAALPKAFLRHPEVSPRFARGFYRMLDRALVLAGVSKKLCQPALVMALGLVYLSVADAWLKDDTQDLSRTMATIDRRLDLYAKLLDFAKQ